MPFADIGQPNSSTSQFQHPLQDHTNLLSCIRLLDVNDFSKLPNPLPRSQDLPADYFGEPASSGDQVISVSHAWRNQAHPDPTCHKRRLLGQLLSQITAGNGNVETDQPPQSLYLFLDFISIPQRPFRAGQQQRTVEEMEIFKKALQCMHEMYFLSDRIIHLPWEDVEVPGEGVEETLPAQVLLGEEFEQIGTRVQIAPQHHISQSRGRSLRRSHTGTVNPFDQVVSVDGQIVISSAQLASLLAATPQLTTVRHYPFGNYSMIPADARGWVFLERFITMVKCAMMDEDTAKRVVVTPSESILQQIMRGAHLLREAALQEATESSRRGELKRVLESFTVELGTKQFSPASTDKRELASSTAAQVEDRSVVSQIMQEFVEHLSKHWEAESARQRRLGSRLKAVVAVAETYLVEWEYFSADYSAMLSAASESNPWHLVWQLVLVILIPPPVVLWHLLWPYSSPDAGWDSQGEFWGLSVSLAFFWICFALTYAVATGADLPNSRTMLLLHVVWAIMTTAIIIAVGSGVAATWQVFPVPLFLFIAAGIIGAALPALWWTTPRRQRASRQFQVRLVTSMVSTIGILTLYGMAVPLLNGAIPLVSEAWQPLLVSGYLALKLCFEFFGLKLSKILGADRMPNYIYIAAFLYQINLCIAFSKVTSWFLVVEQIGFDVLENCYHLYSLFRQNDSDRAGARRVEYIIASLALREFVEVLAPAIFLVVHEVMKGVRPESFELFCERTEQEIQRTVRFISVAIAVELFVSCVTYGILRSRGHKPLRLLRSVIATRFDSFAMIACGALSFYFSMQHSHFGMDLQFKFSWVAKPDVSVWRCGLTWATPS